LYYSAAGQLFPLCEWRRYYYAVFAASGVAPLVIYSYALNEAARYAVSGDRVILGRAVSPEEYAAWMAIQSMSIFLAALAASAAHVFALKNLMPSGKYPPLPGSRSRLDRSVEMLGTADDICTLSMPHDGLQRLICRGDVSAADELPNYALIIAAGTLVKACSAARTLGASEVYAAVTHCQLLRDSREKVRSCIDRLICTDTILNEFAEVKAGPILRKELEKLL
jgi:hypothetical protein